MTDKTACILGNTNLNYSWFVKTFRQGLVLNGYEVIEIDYKTTCPEVIKNILMASKPSVCFTHLTFHGIYPVSKILEIFKDINVSVGTKFIHVLGDARSEPRYNGSMDGAFHMAFINQTENLEKFQNYWNIPVVFAPYCALKYDDLGQYNSRLDYKSLIFMGSETHRERSNLLHNIRAIGVPFKMFYTQGRDDKREVTHDLVASNHAVLSACTGYDIKHYNEVRPWQLLGSGAVIIHKTFKGEDDLIPSDLYYHHNFNASEVKCVYEDIVSSDTTKIRRSAFEFIQRYHNSQVRLDNILKVIDEKQDTTRSFIWELA